MDKSAIYSAIKFYAIGYWGAAFVFLLLPNLVVGFHAPLGFLILVSIGSLIACKQQVNIYHRAFEKTEIEKILLITLSCHLPIKCIYFIWVFSSREYKDPDFAFLMAAIVFNVTLLLEVISQIVIFTKVGKTMAKKRLSADQSDP